MIFIFEIPNEVKVEAKTENVQIQLLHFQVLINSC
jgi:hypothetical protein